MKVPAEVPAGLRWASPLQGVLGSGLGVLLGAGGTTLLFSVPLRAPGGKVVDVVEEGGGRGRSLEDSLEEEGERRSDEEEALEWWERAGCWRCLRRASGRNR